MREITEQEIEFFIKESKSLLRDLQKKFCSWLEEAFLKKYGDKYWHKIKPSLGITDDEKRNYDSWNEIRDLDFFGLLKLAERNFQTIQSVKKLPKEYKNILSQVKQTRHKIEGHSSTKPIKLVELESEFITIKHFSDKLDLPPFLITKIDDLKNRISQFVLAEKGIIPYPGEITDTDVSMLPNNEENKIVIQTFTDYLQNVNLTASQKMAVQQFELFLNDDTKKCFILKGYAGTGKTFLIGMLVKYLKQIRINTRIMAPTGRAARIVAERYNINASTIHRSIYYSKEIKQYETKDESGKITYKWYFDLLNNDDEQGTIFIVDEASMISDVYSENEFIRFGSGHLLYDLLKYINFDGNDNKKKLILVGDDAQLPPIDMPHSPALSEEYLNNKFKLEVSSAKLVDVRRQDERSKILELANSFRNSIDNRIHNAFSFIYDEKEIIKLDQTHFIPNYFELTNKKVDSETIIITYTNSSASDYNKVIRESIFSNPKEIQIGDRVVVVKNNYSSYIDIMNGQMGLVQNVSPFSETHLVPLNKGKKEKGGKDVIFVKLVFRKLEIKFYDTDGSEHILPFVVLENLLDNDQAGITSDEAKALYVFFTQRNPQLKPGSVEFKQTLRVDIYFNALHIKYGYAITCHKSQGGSWKNVFIDFSDRNKLSIEDLRWGYTAVTRAEKKLFLTNTIDHSLLRPLNMTENDLLTIENEPEFLPIEVELSTKKADLMKVPDTFIGQEAYMKRMISSVCKLFPPNCCFVEDIHRDYLEQYKFESNGQKVIVKLHYNKTYKISNVECQHFPDELDDVKDSLYRLKGKVFSDTEIDKNNLPIKSFEGDSNYFLLKEIHERYNDYGMEIFINKNTDYHYTINVQFGLDNENLNYFLDKKHRLKTIIPTSENFNKIIYNRVLRIHLTK